MKNKRRSKGWRGLRARCRAWTPKPQTLSRRPSTLGPKFQIVYRRSVGSEYQLWGFGTFKITPQFEGMVRTARALPHLAGQLRVF